jgi:hypothetical protein
VCAWAMHAVEFVMQARLPSFCFVYAFLIANDVMPVMVIMSICTDEYRNEV